MAAKVMPSSTSARALLALVLVASVSGCGFFRRLAGNDTISLEKAEVKSMAVDLRRQQKTICPREPVQMAVFAEVVLDGDKSAKQLETWAGRDANKNDKLDFVDFAFHSEQGKFDRDGWFAPNPNLLATVGKEFEIRSVFKRRPDKFSFTTTYKPDYACITGAGGSASPGASGSDGSQGASGKDGASGSTSSAGGAGGDGGSGTGGGAGGDGAPGPHLTAFATVVKTPFYDRLVAISLEGDTQDFLLVPEGQPVTLRANGGAGGSGGHGGAGGQGGRGGGGNPGGAGGKGGQGGPGGNGGNGGNGGTIDLVYDARFADLASQIRLDVSGGSAGSGGGGGHGGGTGPGGSGMTPSGSSGQSPPQAQRGSDGSEGAQGSSGNAGRQGPPGRAAAKPGDVKDKFQGSAEITLL
ncbi:MAG: collagen-like protein [Labilithrix sp.]|nr:collagen-like protein [Labilithrix sp.]